MVASVSPIPVGNALCITLAPPKAATLWHLLRNTSNVFAGPADPDSTLVAESVEPVIYDSLGLTNGVTYWYFAYYWDGTAWLPDDASMSGIPQSTYLDQSIDTLTLVRARLDYGIRNEILLGHLTPGEKAGGEIAVLTAPPIFEQVQFPVIVVHLANEAPGTFGVGTDVSTAGVDVSGDWSDDEGYLARTTITVTGWTLNPDARIALRKALRRLMLANSQVFSTAGLRELAFSQTDEDELTGTYGCPVYFTVGTFSCLTPIIVGAQVAPIADVTVTVNAVYPSNSGSH